jgi:hypothetical protein
LLGGFVDEVLPLGDAVAHGSDLPRSGLWRTGKPQDRADAGLEGGVEGCGKVLEAGDDVGVSGGEVSGLAGVVRED